jgi:GntR family transcriptional regulator, transcriptional repressor for pyruvate dehydrogenase complex
MILKPIESKTVVEKIVQQITDSILEGELKPGDKIPTETEMIQTLGIGRNSVREAIKMLSALGILEIRRGDGTYITKNISSLVLDPLVYSVIIEQSSNDEIVELRETLEIDVLEMAIDKVTADDITGLKKLLEDSNDAYRQKDLDKMATIDLEFHFTLIEIARNSMLGKIAKGIIQLFFSSIRKTLQDYEVVQQDFNVSHIEMVDLLIQKDKSRVKSVVQKSLFGWKNYVK